MHALHRSPHAGGSSDERPGPNADCSGSTARDQCSDEDTLESRDDAAELAASLSEGLARLEAVFAKEATTGATPLLRGKPRENLISPSRAQSSLRRRLRQARTDPEDDGP